jgi:AraC family transcriptional regulator of adaptative response/methylated-DNA-[protein]-cysteine methyltransferase
MNRNRDYEKIAQAIEYIEGNFKFQPSLDEVAKKVGLSPFHFQRLFTKWAGTSPKKFLQYISLEHAKKLLEDQTSMLQAAAKTGLSGSGRLHDLFVTIEGMTPGQYKNGGKNLTIRYGFYPSPFGPVLVACTDKGVCFVGFAQAKYSELADLKRRFPRAKFIEKSDPSHKSVMKIFQGDWKNLARVRLHLKGTPFQLKVWQALLKVPFGRVTTYGEIARRIKHPKASRAVGAAIGSNPVSFLIPCHRVIQSTGAWGDYHWGHARKTAMLGWEAARSQF